MVYKRYSSTIGFTIVELLVVIVVIGILATITIVSYTGIQQKAVVASLTSDLDNASKQLKLYQIDHSVYPTSLNASNCPLDSLGVVDNTYCLKLSSGNTFLYSSNNNSTPQTFSLYAINTNTNTKYRTTNDLTPTLYTPVVATGGTITNIGGYRIHTFTTSGTFTVTNAGDIEYLIVAGGGGGGSNSSYSATGAGGGGGGGLSTGSIAINAQTYSVIIGAGGSGKVGYGNGSPGGDSSAFTITTIGGGFGAGVSAAGGSGGSGGGASNASANSGGSGVPGQGNSGGAGFSGNGGGGGGGASAAGGFGDNGIGGTGGAGSSNSFRTGLAENYSGGGGGGGGTGGTGGGGGSGIGGQGGSTATSSNSTNGTPNTGGGGGGGSYGASAYGGNGGSGIVIVRYPI